MKAGVTMRLGAMLTMMVLALVWSAALGAAGESRLDTAAIERLTGAKGELSEKEGVFKVSVPRRDLDINVTGVKMMPHDPGVAAHRVPALLGRRPHTRVGQRAQSCA